MPELDWSGILDVLGDGVVAADRTGTVVYANTAVERLLGWPGGGLKGQPLVVLMPERLQPLHEAGFQRYLATGVARLIGRAVRVPALRRDGTEVDIELTLSSQRDELFVACLRDLRDRVELERQLAVTRYMAAATGAAARLSERLELDHVLDVATSTLARDLDAALARVWLVDPATNTLELRASAGLSTGVEASARQRLDIATYPLALGVVARTLRPVVRNGLAGDPEFDQAWLEREGLRAAAVYPLLSGGALRGVLAGFFRHELPQEVIEVLGTFAVLVASSVENARLYVQAQAAILARDEFLSMASHELRTPLTPLLLNVQSLARLAASADVVPAEKVRAKTASAARAVSHLERLVARMLDVSHLQEQRLVLTPEPLDLVELLGQVVERYDPEAKSLGCRLQVTAPPALVGRWDRLRLDQVISNLLSNALKYGRGKPIEVTLRPAEGGAALTLRDQGIGIAPDDQAKIFTRFMRVAGETKYGGFGLGLWITKELVQAMGGVVTVESAPGLGSTFTVLLPAGAYAPLEPVESGEPMESGESGEPGEPEHGSAGGAA